MIYNNIVRASGLNFNQVCLDQNRTRITWPNDLDLDLKPFIQVGIAWCIFESRLCQLNEIDSI